MGFSIVDRIRLGGVVGAGGAGFPSHEKLGKNVEILIANGAECEPLLQADAAIMSRYPSEVLQGMRYAMKEVNATRGIIAVKEKNSSVILKIKEALVDFPMIELITLPNYYPMGDEHVLVNQVTGRIIPEGGIPPDVGIVVNNVTTLYNICRAVEGIPVTERVVTVIGEVKRPCSLNVPVGTQLSELIEAAGGARVERHAVLLGGPMMGKFITDFSRPITKTDGAIIVLPSEHFLVRRKSLPLLSQIKRSKAACCQCSYCTTLCPRNLLGHDLFPHKIMRSLSYGLDHPAGDVTGAVLCCHCGICGIYACVMGLEPSLINMEVKKQLASSGCNNTIHRRKRLSIRENAKDRMVPTKRLTERLGLGQYDTKVPFFDALMKTKQVVIPIKQHIGTESVPVVSVGDVVKRGEVLAEIREKGLGARVHASIGGKVTKIGKSITIKALGSG